MTKIKHKFYLGGESRKISNEQLKVNHQNLNAIRD